MNPTRMPVPPRLVRRLLIDPVWVPIAALLAAILLVVAAVARVIPPARRRRRVMRIAAIGALYLGLDLQLLLGCLLLWLRSPVPARWRSAAATQRWRRRHARLLGRALATLQAGAAQWLGFRVVPIGAEPDVDPTRPLIVLARHAGPGDSFTLVAELITRYDRTPRVVLKRALQWDPGLDVVLSRLGSHFLASPSGAGDDRTAAVGRLAAGLRAGDALLIFPEGGNWTPHRHRRSVLRLLRAGRIQQAGTARSRHHVLPPQPGGTVAALAAAPQADVLVVSHTGLDTLVNPAQIWRSLPLTDRPMRIRSWLHPADTVPREDDAARRWLERQWEQVNDWIDTQPSVD